MLRNALRAFFRFFFRVLSRLDVQGLENIPESGGAIMVANHLGIVDAPLMFALIARGDATALVADKYRYHPVLRPIVMIGHGIWLNREGIDTEALRAARAWIRGGGMLGVAPEGTRSRTGALIEAKTGAAYLASKADCPVIPVAIWGTEGSLSKMFTLRRPQIHVQVGRAFRLPALPRGERSAGLERNTDEIMLRIAAMLPPQYHGVYAGHPRLGEFV